MDYEIIVTDMHTPEMISVEIPRPWIVVSCNPPEAEDHSAHHQGERVEKEAAGAIRSEGTTRRIVLRTVEGGDSISEALISGIQLRADRGSSGGESSRFIPGNSSSLLVWTMPTGSLSHEAWVVWGTLAAVVVSGITIGVTGAAFRNKININQLPPPKKIKL